MGIKDTLNILHCIQHVFTEHLLHSNYQYNDTISYAKLKTLKSTLAGQVSQEADPEMEVSIQEIY